MKLIVGLGNPGKEYDGTRHNVGWETIDLLATRHGISVKSRRSRALVGEGLIGTEKVALVKPLTFMNLSGEAVGALARKHQIEPSDVIVICDDVHIELGRLRIRPKGSAGGHNGLTSIIRSLGTQEFIRVRVGIGSSAGDRIKHVLGRFNRAERSIVKEAVMDAADAVESMLADGVEQAMNRFNVTKLVENKPSDDVDKAK